MSRCSLLRVFLLFLCSCIHFTAFAQTDTLISKSNDIPGRVKSATVKDSIKLSAFDFEKDFREHNPIKFPAKLKTGRLIASVVAEGTLYAVSMIGLNQAWYSQYAKSNFHLFDDSREWQQIDKMGHVMSSNIISNICYFTYRWSGVKQTPAILYASAVSLAYMTTIEVMDGYSSGWGFSLSDMTANLAGTSFFMVQQLIWQRQYVKMKMSYHPTIYADMRPEELGNKGLERVLKDYNGLTFWASMGSAVFVPKRSNFPRWICLSLGYGAEGMLGGFKNPDHNDAGERLPQYDRYRKFYLSLDVDFSMIKTRSKFVKLLLLAVNAIKIPFPALEYNSRGQFKFHYLYF